MLFSARALILLLTAIPLYAQSQRIVSTAPSITETLFALGLGSRVVGVTNYCHYPPEANTKARIGTYLTPDVEAIAALHPDLVVVERLPNHLTDDLHRLRIRTVEVDHWTVEDVFKADDIIANAAGVPEAGRRLNAELHHGIDEVRRQIASDKTPSAVFIIAHTPGELTDLIVAGASSYFTEILRIAGARNVFEDIALQYPPISLESILRADPDFIIEMAAPAQEKKQALIRLWQSQPGLRAVRENHFLTVSADLFEVPGPRVVEACRSLAAALHPEVRR